MDAQAADDRQGEDQIERAQRADQDDARDEIGHLPPPL